jgi:hypothetical protein
LHRNGSAGTFPGGDKERKQGLLRVGVSEIVGCAIQQISLTLKVPERRT